MRLRIFGLVSFLLTPLPACTVPTHRAATYGPAPAGASDPAALDTQLSSVTSRINGLDVQISSLNGKIGDYRASPQAGNESLASQAEMERDRLRSERSALESQRSSLQILRNSMQGRSTTPAR